MRSMIFLLMFLVGGCATQYILPTNRFITAESQGGMFNSQFEMQQVYGNQLTANLSNASVNDGVTHSLITRTGYLFSTSLLDSFDFFWSHIGAGNSIFGGKFQLLGGSRTSKATGHKMALSAGLGGNKHQIEGGTTVDFELTASEYMWLYGYRFSEMALIYSNFSYSQFQFNGEVSSSDPTINGLKPTYNTKIYGLFGGIELSYSAFFGKFEYGYQKIMTTDTSDIAQFVFGYSAGFSW